MTEKKQLENPLVPVEDIQSFQDRQNADLIEGVYNALVMNPEVQVIPESVFVTQILPFVCNEAHAQETTPALWASVAGTPFAEMDVRDEKTGNILFRIPALLERDSIDPGMTKKVDSLANIFANATMLRNQSPIRAKGWLQAKLGTLGIRGDIFEMAAAKRERWNKILARYGKTLNGAPVKTAEQLALGHSKADEEFDGYDPL